MSDNKIQKDDLPMVSVIIAVFNGEKYLEETINNIINQTYKSFELIIIDGGSTDGTIDIIKKYDKYISYWSSEPDRGISDAFNKGVNNACGTYINFQGDGDGFYDKESLFEIMKNINPLKDILICGRIQRISQEGSELFVSDNIPTFDKKSLLFRMSLPHQGLFTHKNFFEKYGLFDIHNVFCMDYDHLLRAYHDFPKVITKDIIVAKWRDDGLGNGRTLEILKEYDYIKRKNRVANFLTLSLINYWTLLKYWIKETIGYVKLRKKVEN